MLLSKKLLAASVRPAVTADVVGVVDHEVASKGGLSGRALKAAYGAVNKVMPNASERSVARLLPDALRSLDPFWTAFVSSGDADFGRYLAAQGDEPVQALLAVSDAKVAATSREVIKKAYKPLRNKAGDHVRAALPALGHALQQRAEAT